MTTMPVIIRIRISIGAQYWTLSSSYSLYHCSKYQMLNSLNKKEDQQNFEIFFSCSSSSIIWMQRCIMISNNNTRHTRHSMPMPITIDFNCIHLHSHWNDSSFRPLPQWIMPFHMKICNLFIVICVCVWDTYLHQMCLGCPCISNKLVVSVDFIIIWWLCMESNVCNIVFDGRCSVFSVPSSVLCTRVLHLGNIAYSTFNEFNIKR